MSISYIKFDVTSGSISSFVRSHDNKVFHLDNNQLLFAINMGDGMSIFVKCSDSVARSEEIYTRDVSIFDKTLSITYISFLELVFELTSSFVDSMTFKVETWTGAGARCIGELRLTGSGRVYFNGEPVETTKMRSLYGKCVALRG